MRRERIFELDRAGGREKVTRAIYSPKQYRRENGKVRRNWSVLLAVVIGATLGCVLYAVM